MAPMTTITQAQPQVFGGGRLADPRDACDMPTSTRRAALHVWVSTADRGPTVKLQPLREAAGRLGGALWPRLPRQGYQGRQGAREAARTGCFAEGQCVLVAGWGAGPTALKATRGTRAANVRLDGYKPTPPCIQWVGWLAKLRPKNRLRLLVMRGSATLRRSARGSHGTYELAGSGPPLGEDLERRGKRYIDRMHAIAWQDV
jgi:hypothetical protein